MKWQGSYHRFWNRFKLATVLMFVAAVITGAGLLTFAAQNSSTPAQAETTPTPDAITLSATGNEQLGEALGEKCVAKPVRAIALSSQQKGLYVVTIPTALLHWRIRLWVPETRPGTLSGTVALALGRAGR